MDNTNEHSLGQENGIAAEIALGGSLVPELDPADYLSDLDEFDLTEPQKRELLGTLWNIMGAFARMGFQVDVCGLIFEEFNKASAPESDNDKLIASTNTETPTTNKARETTHE